MEKSLRKKLDLPFTSDAEVIDMVARFEACTWPYPRWTHRAHLGVALFYMWQYPIEAALERIRHHIQLYNRTCGDPSGYHETITILFMRRVDRYLRDNPELVSLSGAVEALAKDCDMYWLLGYYSHDRLWSAEAKSGWVEPDLRPLDF